MIAQLEGGWINEKMKGRRLCACLCVNFAHPKTVKARCDAQPHTGVKIGIICQVSVAL